METTQVNYWIINPTALLQACTDSFIGLMDINAVLFIALEDASFNTWEWVAFDNFTGKCNTSRLDSDSFASGVRTLERAKLLKRIANGTYMINPYIIFTEDDELTEHARMLWNTL